MISRLYIKNFILIKEISLDLHDGFSAITGETGAGKSILVGAIGLILGSRADSKSVRAGANKAIIEAEFLTDGIEGLKELFDREALDYESTCILRREVLSSGKSRAFVNDTPVTLNVLRAIGERLVDIHSQHHNMLIGDEGYQMRVLDTLANNASLLQEYSAAYERYGDALRQLKSETKRLQEQKKEEDYLTFQYKQLDDAHLKSGEWAQLEERQAMAAHGQEINEALRLVASFDHPVSDEYPSVNEQITSAVKMLDRVSEHYSQAAELHERLNSLSLELSDIIREADSLLDGVDVDPQELEQLEARLDLLQGLLFKHNLTEFEELIDLRDRYAEQLAEISDSDYHLSELEKEVKERKKEALQLAKSLSATRQKAADEMLPVLHELMTELGIAGATFKVEQTELSQLDEYGIDQIQFLFATNKQTTLQPIREIASGGEISRFMLALKSVIAAHRVLPTVIFDEIDTGVSGEVAEKLGRVMKRLSLHIQVLSITHLPQIAALAEHQLVVAKVEEADGYVTGIKEVEGEERVKELASMLSGAELTDAAIANAKELLTKKNK